MDHQLANEPIYLDRNGCDVQISPLFAQHLRPFQRDGIRFLYHAYIQKQPGIILNDSSGHGKTVQTALFVEVVLKTFHKSPALILCDAENVLHWKYIFEIWTNLAKDDTGEIIVSAINNAEEMSRRQWGLVVVDSSDAINLMKVFQRIKTDFKIWKTSEHLFGNLKRLHAIHRWIDPGAPCLDKYAVRPSTLAARVRARIELDTIFYHVLLRRTNQRLVFNTQMQQKLFETWKTNQTIDRQAYFGSSTEKLAHESTNEAEHSSNPLSNIPAHQNKNVEGPRKNVKHKTDQNETLSESKKTRIDVTDEASQFTTLTPCHMQPVLANIQRTTEQCLPLIRNEERSNINVLVDKQPMNNLAQANILNNESIIKELNLNKVNIEAMNGSDDGKETCTDIEHMHTQTQKNITSDNYQIGKSRATLVDNLIENEDSFSEEADTQRLECTKMKIRSSLKTIEELANKQFKGSLLDSLF